MDESELANTVSQLRLLGTDQQSIEVKSNVGKSILSTLGAFSNSGGGIVLIGLDESAGFTTVPEFDAEAARDALVERSDQLTPAVRPLVEIISFEDSALVYAEIREMRPHDKPCYVTERGMYNGSFVRAGDGDHRLRPYEIDRLVEEKTQPKWDEDPVSEASLDDLNGTILDDFLDKQRIQRQRTFAQGRGKAMQRLRVVYDDSPTLAALLSMGEYPQEFFPRLTVAFAVFPGVTRGDIGKGIRMLDSATLSGPIPELVEEALRRVSLNMNVGALIDDVYRRELPDYPLVAVREAVVNALMHRDYSPEARGTQVQVSLFADRLEITNPGGLFGAVTVRSLGESAISSSRNQRLSTLLESIETREGGMIAENRGTGFAVMNEELEKALMPPVEVRDELTRFTVTFRRRRVAQQETYLPAKDRIRQLSHETSSFTTTEMVSKTNLSRSAVQKAINELISEGLLEPTQPVKSPRQRYRRPTIK